MRKSVVGVAIALGLVALGMGAVVAMGGSPAPAVTRAAPAASGGPSDAPPDTRPGISLVPSVEASALDSATAMAKAGELCNLGGASGVVIGKYRFTSDELADSVAPKNALVWVVTLNGVSIPGRGGVSRETTPGSSVRVFRQLNVVIDANTGKGFVSFPRLPDR
jgi:hypothetical protein